MLVKGKENFMLFHERLLSLRKNSKLSQKDIAVELGISLRSYQYYERGEREPTVSILLILAKIFHTSVDYLIGCTDNPQILSLGGLNPSVARLQGKILTIDSQTADELENYLDYLNFKKSNH